MSWTSRRQYNFFTESWAHNDFSRPAHCTDSTFTSPKITSQRLLDEKQAAIFVKQHIPPAPLLGPICTP